CLAMKSAEGIPSARSGAFLLSEFGAKNSLAAFFFRNFGEPGATYKQAHLDRLTNEMVLAALSVQFKRVVAKFRLGSEHERAGADRAIEVGIGRCFADRLAVDLHRFLQRRTEAGVTE